MAGPTPRFDFCLSWDFARNFPLGPDDAAIPFLRLVKDAILQAHPCAIPVSSHNVLVATFVCGVVRLAVIECGQPRRGLFLLTRELLLLVVPGQQQLVPQALVHFSGPSLYYL